MILIIITITTTMIIIILKIIIIRDHYLIRRGGGYEWRTNFFYAKNFQTPNISTHVFQVIVTH